MHTCASEVQSSALVLPLFYPYEVQPTICLKAVSGLNEIASLIRIVQATHAMAKLKTDRRM